MFRSGHMFTAPSIEGEGHCYRTMLKHRKFHLNARKMFFPLRVRNTGTSCQEELWCLLLWRHSKATWTQSSATCSSWPCFDRGVGLDDPQRSFPTPTILWFCDSVTGWLKTDTQHQAASLVTIFLFLKKIPVFCSMGLANPCVTQLHLSIQFEKKCGHCDLYKLRMSEAVYAWSVEEFLSFSSEALLQIYATYSSLLNICSRLFVVFCSLSPIFQ